MSKIAYQAVNLGPKRMLVVQRANEIIAEYARIDQRMTLRQLYYQFVSRNWIANKQTEYDNLQETINQARLGGYIDWMAIEDLTREHDDVYSDDRTVREYLEATGNGYRMNRWVGQPRHIEVWVEKQALLSIVRRAVQPVNCISFACRGYVSQSEMWTASQRLCFREDDGQRTLILHLGDHDPSGIDMTRDIRERLQMFMSRHGRRPAEVRRIALTMDQIQQFNPPPNPVKMSDGRARAYMDEYGVEDSWELDALPPNVLIQLIRDEVNAEIDHDKRAEVIVEERKRKAVFKAIRERTDDIADLVSTCDKCGYADFEHYDGCANAPDEDAESEELGTDDDY